MSQELENRFLNFARAVRDFCQYLKKDTVNIEYIKQLIRASSSIGANYIEASDSLGKADERMKIRISRREAREAAFFLNLVHIQDDLTLENLRNKLEDEANQIRRILSAILLKLK